MEALGCAWLRLAIACGRSDEARAFAQALRSAAGARGLRRTLMRALVLCVVLEERAGEQWRTGAGRSVAVAALVDERGPQARPRGAGMTGGVECRYYGRDFTAQEMTLLRALVAGPLPLNRLALSKEFCRRIGWFKPDGGLKDMMARVARPAPRAIRLPRRRSAWPSIQNGPASSTSRESRLQPVSVTTTVSPGAAPMPRS